MNVFLKNSTVLLVIALSVQAHFFLDAHAEKSAIDFPIGEQSIVLKDSKTNATKVVIIEAPKKQIKEHKDNSRFSDINLLQFVVQKVKEGIPSFGY
jgi:hypothetical protein